MKKCFKHIPCCGCTDWGTCEKERVSRLLTKNDIAKENADGDFLAVCDNGKEYECSYSTEYKTIFFTIPSGVNVLGYVRR